MQENGEAMVGADLRKLADIALKAQRMLKSLSTRIGHIGILEGLLIHGYFNDFVSSNDQHLLRYIEQQETTNAKWTFERNPSNITFHRTHLGVSESWIVDVSLFDLPSARSLASLKQAIGTIFDGAVTVEMTHRGELKQHILYGPSALAALLLEVGRRGIAINRYKGLGEMNPEQLWETTLDPQCRTLLQVKLSHAEEAEAVFSTLMGDVVEPRRKFIQENALNVVNLDV